MGVSQTHESFEDHIERRASARVRLAVARNVEYQKSPLRLRPAGWCARRYAAGGDLSTRFAWPRSLLLDQDSDGRVDFPVWWSRFIRLGEYCCLVCLQHSLLIHHNSYLCSTDSCGPQLSMLAQHPLVHAVPWVSSVGLSLEWLFSLLMLWEPPDDISDRGQRRMQKRLLSEYTSLGPHFLLDRAAHRAPMLASTGWSRTRGSTRRHSYPRAGRLVADCRHCLSTVPGSRSPTIACPPRAASCRRPSCVRPGFPVTRSTRAVSESDIRRTSSHHLRVEREGADGANTFIIARGFDAGVDLYSAVLSSRHSVENPEGCMALDSAQR